MTRQPLFLTLLAVGCGSGFGPVVTEPMPDIPETVEYETVRIEYGDDDLVANRGTTLGSALVGDPSVVAALARGIVRGTNGTIRGQFILLDAVMDQRPTEWTEDSWTWDNSELRRRDELFSNFTILEEEDGDLSYEWRVGRTEEERLVIFSGTFAPRDREEGRQRGEGIIRFHFDNIRTVQPEEEGPVGTIVIAFRSIGDVRQVRVATLDYADPGKERENSLSEYVQFPDGNGRFRFSTRVDFLKDGDPRELMSVDAVWNVGGEGRSLVRLSGGSLPTNELLLEECWDVADRIAFADLTPDVAFPYEDGEPESCATELREFTLTPPEFDPPQDEPAIPGPHPDERT